MISYNLTPIGFVLDYIEQVNCSAFNYTYLTSIKLQIVERFWIIGITIVNK